MSGKVEYAPVLPPAFYPEYDRGYYHLIQAHMIEPGSKLELWTLEKSLRFDHTVILDNGLIELGEADPATLIKVASRVKPQEVICPDAMNDRQMTIEYFKHFGKACAKVCGRVMLVPQGKSIPEWCDCCEELIHLAEEAKVWFTIGVSKLIEKHPGGRWAALAWMTHTFGLIDEHSVHLLGIERDIFNVMKCCRDFPIVRGLDSTWGFAETFEDRVFTGTSKPKMPDHCWEMTPGEVDGRLLEVNIALIRQYINLAEKGVFYV